MIRFLLFTLFATFTQTIFAQDYSLFHSSDTCTYNNEAEYPDIKLKYTSLIVDSSKSNGGINTQFFPNTLGQNKKCFGVSPTWIGPKLWNDSNGDQYLLNHKNDTVSFKFQSNAVDSTWIFLRLGAGKYLEATRLSDELENIVFTEDSIKRFQLELRDSSGSLISDGINNIEIQISKNHGVIQGIDFYSLFYDSTMKKIKFRPITLVGKNGVGGVLPLTRRDVFDFEIEDRFHYDILENDVQTRVRVEGSYERITVMEKNLVGNSVTYMMNSEKYLRKRFYYPEGEHETKEFIDKVYEVTYDNLEELYAGLPGLVFGNMSANWYCDTLKNVKGLVSETITDYQIMDSCASSFVFESYNNSECGKGLGEWFHSTQRDAGILRSEKKWLVYYNKSGDEWGSPVSVFNENGKTKPLSVYPNPSKGTFNLVGISPSLIQVYELSGRKVAEQMIEKNQSNTTEIDISFLENGVYIFKAFSRDIQYSQRIQIQH